MKKLVILGGGESGVGAAILGKKNGWEVFLSDKLPLQEKYKKELVARGISFEEGKHTMEKILSAHCIVKSPGIPDKVEIVQRAKAQNIEIISEIEFAYRYLNPNCKIIAITGSNGKTTTTTLTYELLKNTGFKVGLGGNIGQSFALQVCEQNFDYFVLEISSFQLDGIVNFRPHIAILLNITPDHLDRYEYKFENYVASKFRIIENQTQDDFFIYNSDDSAIMAHLQGKDILPQHLPFSLIKTLPFGGYMFGNEIVIKTFNDIFSIHATEINLKGKHNIMNTIAATTASLLLKARKQSTRNTLISFQGVAHRLEFVRELKGVRYINDSKATNVNSVYFALESIEKNHPEQKNIILILGGQDKGNDYNEIAPLVKDKVKMIICLGKDNTPIIEFFKNYDIPIRQTQSMNSCVRISHDTAQVGDVVLLSPACASFDLFKNYEDRGEQFRGYVEKL